MLFASLAASLFSAFLAMLGKQWLNRYDSTDIRGTAIERARIRQRKLNGIITWYFHYVMESLPLMLQAALLLLGCALSRYLWEVNITVASVVLGITSFGVALYLLIVIAGAAFESCPYQTPGASISHPIVRYILYHLHPAVISSWLPVTFILVLIGLRSGRKPLPPRHRILIFCGLLVLFIIIATLGLVPLALSCSVLLVVGGPILLWRITLPWLARFGKSAYHWFTHLPQAHGLDQHTITLDLECISWILQTSLDKLAHLTALKHLAAMPELARLNPTLVVGCFNVFINCVSVSDRRVVIKRGFEELAALSASSLLRTFLHLSVMDATSGAPVDIRRHYNKVFPYHMDFTGLPFRSTMTKIHVLLGKLPMFQRNTDVLPISERIQFSWDIVNTAREATQWTQHREVPRRFLRFVVYSLSMDPPPPVSTVADCLKIVAIAFGCDLSNIITSEDRYVCPDLTIIYISD